MSCRTTTSGSLAISYVTREFKLKDGQCTSLYHQLKNEARIYDYRVDEEDYYAMARMMRRKISRNLSNVWTPGRQRNALAKAEEVLTTDMPDNQHAYAFLNINNAANRARAALSRLFTRYSDIYVISEQDCEAEFNRLYEEGVSLSQGFIRARCNQLPPLYPQDNATRYALGTLDRGDRCPVCGQFKGRDVPHHCPTGTGSRRCPVCGGVNYGLGNRHVCHPGISQFDDEEYDESVTEEQEPLADWERVLLDAVRETQPLPDNFLEDLRNRLQNDNSNVSRTARPRPARARRTAAIVTEPAVPIIPPQPLPVSWVEDMSAFQRTYDKVRAHIPPGTPTLPTFPDLEQIPGGITGGLSLPGSGNTFGLELEFDFPDETEPYTLRNVFASTLYNEGISLTSEVMRWHFIGDEGADRPGGVFSETPYGWSIESDRSVDGLDGARGLEIKSQILYDDPQTWKNLRRICEVATSLGGKATPRCGLHVNVSAYGYPPDNPANHTRLLKLAASYDDTLIRLAHNPASGPTHRGRRYCAAVDLPPEGFNSVQMAKAWSNHYQAFNLNNVPDERSRRTSTSRIEVRLFDASLDVGRIQAQVALSLGLISAARNEIEPLQGPEYSGTHRTAYGARNLEGERWIASTASFRQLVDILGTQGLNRTEHREMLMGLFTSTKWQDRQ